MSLAGRLPARLLSLAMSSSLHGRLPVIIVQLFRAYENVLRKPPPTGRISGGSSGGWLEAEGCAPKVSRQGPVISLQQHKRVPASGLFRQSPVFYALCKS